MNANAISYHDLTKGELGQVLNAFEIPTCPAMVAEVMKEARKEVPDIRKLATAIAADVGMSAITLKMANSALFRSGAPVDNVQRALDRLGTRNVLSVVMGTALRSSMVGLPSDMIDQFWHRCSIMAQSAGFFARQLYAIAPDAAFNYALFHDAAIPLMQKRFPEYPELIADAATRGEDRIQAERHLPCTHPIIGSLLVRNWGLSNDVAMAIRFHHEPDIFTLDEASLPSESVSLIAVGYVIEYVMAEIMPKEESEVSREMFEQAMEHLGVPLDDQDAIADVIKKMSAESGH